MAKYRFVWRKHRSGAPHRNCSAGWKEKHVQAQSPSQAIIKINHHIQQLLRAGDMAELDHLFFEIKEGGLHGDDRLDFTLITSFAVHGRTFVASDELCCAIAGG